MSFTLPKLPYADDALQPYISAETIGFHHGKHHNTYVVNLNKLVQGTDFADKSLEEIVKTSTAGIFNNAAQIWNHNFYWQSMTPNGGKPATGALLEKINADFGSFDNMIKEFKQKAITCFGSGWAWLIKNKDGNLEVTNSSNAATPITEGVTPLLTIDVWEHAYYVDYQNRRPDYVDTFFSKLANWQFASSNYENSL